MTNEKKKDISLAALILAGGKSSRLGNHQNKAYLKLKGRYLIEIVREKLAQIVHNKIIIVGSPEEYSAYLEVVPDIFPQQGPLGGIFSGLKASPSFYNLVVGCDMPFLETNLLSYMIQNIDNYDIIIPCYGKGLIEPLCAVYSKDCLKVIERNLLRKIYAVRKIFPTLRVKYITEEEIKKYDPEFHSFFNINYPGDLKRAEKIYQNKKEDKKSIEK